MMDSWFWFLLLGLASFRLTRLLVYDKIARIIRKSFLDEIEEINEKGEVEEYIVIKGKGLRRWFGELLSCYWCTGVWATTCLFFLVNYFPLIGQPVLIIFAAAGIAGILESAVTKIIE
ncbi:DUF1360 domain-containing protein [Sutcliffiella rhizosphaerae]|uniref:DUF1360 domain-containing protein n=1 Tax=Sutcliffiella rhizosphaerae TaxID=2880967 RepID=A0ABN8A746_9BACI|nr:DUF1360 domain-containing protein [Sutcliffiella rhizosphaerae]CAG9620464.1 hypothetical protein BACCIP111883_01232 [Sutcliffiella rhizosphaerae]